MLIQIEKKDQLFEFFDKEFPFNKDGLTHFIQSFESKTYEKNTILLHADEKEKELRFLDQGTIREYYSKNGKEKNINFFLNSEFITDFHSFITEKPVKKYQETITKVTIRTLSKEKFHKFLKEYTCGKLFLDEIFQRIIDKKEKEEFDWFMNTAEDNYLKLRSQRSDWLQNIPQYYIASYLGISPETLSRIRKKK